MSSNAMSGSRQVEAIYVVQENSNTQILNGLANSPARHLSTEMLVEIFLCCLPMHVEYDESLKFELRFNTSWPVSWEAPVLLGRICRHWRQVALSTPALWSNFYFVESLRFEKLKKAFRLWASLSEPIPISIGIDSSEFIEEIIPYVSRWKTVHTTTDYIPLSTLLEFLDAISSGAPMLESLNICFNIYPEDADGDVKVDFSAAPRLKSLRILNGDVFDCMRVSGSHNVTQIIVGDIYPTSFIEIFKQFPCLTSLKAVVECAYDDSFFNRLQNTDVHSASHLREIDLSARASGMGRLLDLMKLPSLENISIHFNVTQISLVMHLKSLLERSCCVLTKLMISQSGYFEYQNTIFAEAKASHMRLLAHYPASDLISLARMTQDIEELIIKTHIDDWKTFLTVLASKPGEADAIWPKLKHLYLGIPCTYPYIQALIVSRCGRTYKEEQKLKLILGGATHEELNSHTDFVQVCRNYHVQFKVDHSSSEKPCEIDEYLNFIRLQRRSMN